MKWSETGLTTNKVRGREGEEYYCLNREWTRIHANSCRVQRGGVSNESSAGTSWEAMAQNRFIFRCFNFIRVHSRPFAVQFCFPSTLPNSASPQSVLCSSPRINSLDFVLRTSFVVEPRNAPFVESKRDRCVPLAIHTPYCQLHPFDSRVCLVRLPM